MTINDIPRAFLTYYETFPYDEMNQLKLNHTRRVVENARFIMKTESFSPELVELGEMAAWLHDLGRFSQFTQYRTFSDSQSVNHALLSCGEALRLGWLDDWSPKERNLILQAIAFHNLRDLPPNLSEEELLLAHLIRDADKLDIFTVLDEAIRTHYLESHPEVYWGLPFTAPPTEAVVEQLLSGKSVSYSDIHSFADFIFIQISWCTGGLYFNGSRQLTLERNEVEIRRNYLTRILPQYQATIERCCAAAELALSEKK